MKWQTNACPDRTAGADLGPLRSLLTAAGVAILLLGCTQDPVGTAPGGLEPSASSQRSDAREDTGPGGGPSADPTSTSDDAGDDDGGSASGSGSGGVSGPDGGGASGSN
jgi:hypothetical protein